MIDSHDYGIEVRRRTMDDEILFEARVRELPDVAEYAETFEEAYTLALDTIETTAEALSERGRAMPMPQVPVDSWSGRVTLRVPKTLHRALAEAAEAEGCSLNQYMVNVLSYFSGFAHAERAVQDRWIPQPSSSGAGKSTHLRLVSSQNYDTTRRVYG